MRHGHTRNGKESSEYISWAHMKTRCQNPNNDRYHRYGGRGIKVCERWQSFENFLADMGVRPPGLTLERMDNDSNYEPGNCKWATQKEQANNKGVHFNQYWFIAFSPNGEHFVSNNQSKFAEKYELDHRHIADCLNGKLKTHGKWRFKRL